LYSLTNRYYKEGYEEGFADGLRSGPEEGFEFGHQVAFQKFLPNGILLGRCEIWKLGLQRDCYAGIPAAKKARALRQIDLLEGMILGLETRNETELEDGKFEEMKRKIMAKRRVVESLIGEEQCRDQSAELGDEDSVALAKRMDRELQL
jgi:Essential protein Yae1, N terminal